MEQGDGETAEKDEVAPIICYGGVKIDQQGHVRCMHCGDDLGELKTDPEEQYEQVTPTGSCWPCAMGVEPRGVEEDYEGFEPEGYDPDLGYDPGPCVICGSLGACGVDDEGRAMIHVVGDDDD